MEHTPRDTQRAVYNALRQHDRHRNASALVVLAVATVLIVGMAVLAAYGF